MPVDCFDFDDHAIVDDQVEAKTAFEAKPFIDDGDNELPLERVAPKAQLVDEARLVD